MTSGIVATVQALVEAATASGKKARLKRATQAPHVRSNYASSVLIHSERSNPQIEDIQVRAPEPTLVALGWRFHAVPAYRPKRLSTLDWDCRSWLAIPPERSGVPARHFQKKAEALAWAIGLPDEWSGG